MWPNGIGCHLGHIHCITATYTVPRPQGIGRAKDQAGRHSDRAWTSHQSGSRSMGFRWVLYQGYLWWPGLSLAFHMWLRAQQVVSAFREPLTQQPAASLEPSDINSPARGTALTALTPVRSRVTSLALPYLQDRTKKNNNHHNHQSW